MQRRFPNGAAFLNQANDKKCLNANNRHRLLLSIKQSIPAAKIANDFSCCVVTRRSCNPAARMRT